MTQRLTRAEQRERTRQRLLDAAERLFTERGFAAVTVDQIAEAAGFTIGALYSNFSGKEELFLCVADRWIEAETAGYVAAFDRATTDTARLQSLAEWLAGDLDQVLPRMRPQVEFQTHAVGRPDLAAQVRGRQRALLAELTASLAEQSSALGGAPVLEPEDLAVVVAALANGLTLQRLLDPDLDIGRVFGATVAALLSGPSDRPESLTTERPRPRPRRSKR